MPAPASLLKDTFGNDLFRRFQLERIETVRAGIKACQGFCKSNEFVASFNRENPFFEAQPKREAALRTTRALVLQINDAWPSGVCKRRPLIERQPGFLAFW